ncbi:MAG: hypothetical protein WA885_23615 [Phormidesmis sp.]
MSEQLVGFTQLPGQDAFSNLWPLISGAIALNGDTFQRIHTQPHSLLAALTIVFLAGFAQSLSQMAVLFINQVQPIRFVLSLLISALFFMVGYGFWTLSIWMTLNFAFHSHVPFAVVLRTLGFSYAPLMLLGVFVMLPYFGGGVFVLLSIWTLLAVIVGIEAVSPLGRWAAFESAALGWVVLQLLQKTVGQPIASLGQWITNWVANEELITNRKRLAQELYAGLRAQRASTDVQMAEDRQRVDAELLARPGQRRPDSRP